MCYLKKDAGSASIQLRALLHISKIHVFLFLLHVGMSVCILVSPKQPKLIEQRQKIMKATEPASQPAVSRLVIFHHVL